MTSVLSENERPHPADPRATACARLIGAGLLLCVLVFYGAPQLGLEKFTVPKDLVLSLFGWGAALVFLSRRVPSFPDWRLLAACGTLVLVTLLAATGATNPWYAGRAVLGTASAVVVFLLAFALSAEGQEGRLVRSVALATVVASVVALAESIRIIPSVSLFGRAPGGSLGNRNFLSHLLVVGAALVVLELHAHHGLKARIAWALGLGCTVAAITVTRCRASWLAAMIMLFGTLGILAVKRSGLTREAKRTWAGAALAVSVGVALGVLFFGRGLGWSPGDYGATLARIAEHPTGTGRGRLIQYGVSLRMLADHPLLGVGPGQWSIAYPGYAVAGDPSYRAADPVPMNRLPSSDWLGLAVEAGLPAAGLAFAIAGLLLWRTLRQPALGGRRGLALVAVLTAVAVVGTFDAFLSRPETAFLAAVALGAVAGAVPADKTREIGLPRVPSLVVAAVLFVGAVTFTGTRMAASVVRRNTSMPDLEKALRLDPGNFVLATTIAYRYQAFRRCDLAVPYAHRALRLYPPATVPRTILQRCADQRPK